MKMDAEMKRLTLIVVRCAGISVQVRCAGISVQVRCAELTTKGVQPALVTFGSRIAPQSPGVTMPEQILCLLQLCN